MLQSFPTPKIPQITIILLPKNQLVAAMQTVKVVVCVREVRLVISKSLCLTKLVHPGTSERACITGAPPPLPFERGATGAQVPLH